MLQIAAYELEYIQFHGTPAVGFAFFIFKADTAVLNMNDTIVGDGDFKDIWCKIPEASFTTAESLTINIEVLLPNLRRDLCIKRILFHRITELSLEYDGHGLYRQIEIDA